MDTVTIESSSAERLRSPIEYRLDPTGSTVEFALTTGARTDPDTWVAGSWEGSWDARTGKVTALSPITGTTDFAPAQDVDYDVWVRFGAVSGETPVLLAGRLRAR